MNGQTRKLRWVRTFSTAALACALFFLISPAVFAGDDPCEKHLKHMEKYYKHLREAQEEAREGDWDDYYEEMEKADKDLEKARAYERQCRHHEVERRHERGRYDRQDHHEVDRRHGRRRYDTRDRDCSCRRGRSHHPDRRHGRHGRGFRRHRQIRHHDLGDLLRGLQLRIGDGRVDVRVGGRDNRRRH